MTDTVPAAFFAQWKERQAENNRLQERVDALMNEKVGWLNEKMALVEEKSGLQDENRQLCDKYDYLKKKYDELMEEHQNYVEKMAAAYERLKQELEDARSDFATRHESVVAELQCRLEELMSEKMTWTDEKGSLEEEIQELTTRHDALLESHQDYVAKMISTCECLKRELEEAKETSNPPTAMVEQREVLLDKFYNRSTTHLGRKQYLKTVVGCFEGVWQCYVLYKLGIIPPSVLVGYCAGRKETRYRLTQSILNAIKRAGLGVSEYLATVIPLLSDVTEIWLDNTNITTLDWCAALPERIYRLDIAGCHSIKDCTPLTKIRLCVVYCNDYTHSSFDAVKRQLEENGVTIYSSD
ncbi:hypothetical protein AGDE_15478 [Angomonas deanei]|nr:hypothetical protein AGDE_15478 [Angomonas deanei]|eukprot:EPY18998.1 hypothetical protein AGDE_15478 [Angomonas deanei]